MNKTTKNILIGVGVLAGLYFVSKLFKSMRKPSAEQVSKFNMDLVLAKGSEGAEVFELQRILKDELGYDLGYTGVDNDGIDGKFGNITENALMKAKQVKQITLKEMSNEK
jgi:peptidoglycan hydrolase-like protein with peptidoglycan-binding domain